MSAIYKITYTRESTSDDWPLTEFIDLYLANSLPLIAPQNNAECNPVIIGNMFWSHKYGGGPIYLIPEGFENYTYEEYDPSLDYIIDDLKGNGFRHLIGQEFTLIDITNRYLAHNPTSLTWTQILTFNSLENVNEFVDVFNLQFKYPSKFEVLNYMASKGMTANEECYVDGVLTECKKFY